MLPSLSPSCTPRAWRLLPLVALTLCACASKPKGTPDNEPTLATLASRQIVVTPDSGVAVDETQAIAAYRKFLEVAPQAPQRAQAMRRLGDLEMEAAENRYARSDASAPTPDYRAAITRYQEFLKAYPNDAGRDRVLYQLARANEQGGALEVALKTLDQLVRDFPATTYRDEAHFRRGELLFTLRDYVRAESAFATVLGGAQDGAFQERALYMQGWSRFKQGRLEDALHPFFGVLDRKLAAQEGAGELDTVPGLTRADRELVEDTFRVVSLSLQNLKGTDSIPEYITSDVRRGYEFRVYQQLGELYLRQDRSKDAADAFAAFARQQPLHAQAPQLQARVVDIYARAGLDTLALDAKKDYVSRYGHQSEFRRANPAGWALAQPLVKTHLVELARHYHAAAQKSKTSAAYQEAVRWYRAYLDAFPADPDTARNHFLLAELLFEDRQYAQAATEYEKTAYQYPSHAQSADAGYAALLCYAAQEKAASPDDKAGLQRSGVDSALRFAKAFPADARTAAVLADAAERLFALKDADAARRVAQQVLDLNPGAAPAQRRVAWTVLAHGAFERGDFAQAEGHYTEVLALVPANDAARAELTERLAATVYKRGEQARSAGHARDAVAHFARVASVAPQSAVRATAQYDAAAALMGLKDWDGAARTLQDFRQRFPSHPLQSDATAKLALAYTETQQWALAASEFERLAAGTRDAALVRSALWQAAELREKAAQDKATRALAVKSYERFLAQYPQPLESVLETRYRLARLAKADGNPGRELKLMQDILRAEQGGAQARTPRTRYLGATAALALAEPALQAYRKVTLVEPLARQLKLKKARMEDVIKAYSVAADYGVADVSTATTYHLAALYQDFGRALLSSQRPKRLSKAELEQYNVMLEEQADPFEQKATELHELNTQRTTSGIYDHWVQDSYKALATLRPLRYGKVERSEGQPVAAELALAPLEQAATQAPSPANHNRLGIAYRQQGQFAKARAAYEQAVALDPNDASATLNLAILHDLYLHDGARALELYQRYLGLVSGGDATVGKWVADLKNRKPVAVAARPKEPT